MKRVSIPQEKILFLYGEGWPPSRIAHELHLSANTVRREIWKARTSNPTTPPAEEVMP
jgi:DNA-binding NarL/FixJ family response regulator